jgi:hypothetical protein
MEAAAEIADSVQKSHAGHQPMQGDNIAAARAARHASEMSIFQTDAETCMALCAVIVHGAAYGNPCPSAWCL